MRLLSLKIKGFKSFAQEAWLHFNDDVIGIVGPNGSGKSNVIDAIRWVLGEQKTSELRLDTMSNVLFNGTKKRKPSPSAEVTVTFENNKGLLPLEFKQVAITRVLHRSGNSEYRINDVPCRLKDIQSLLSDTGIGSDTYAIIALGMVDEILSDRDAYRRRMLEQAAGISKYKLRKKEAIQKLALTEDDLNRVDDLLAEIGSNLRSLEKQAKKAQKYLAIREEYKLRSLQVGKIQLDRLAEQFVAAEKNIRDESDAYLAKEAQLGLAESEILQSKEVLARLEERLSQDQKQLAVIIQNLRDLESKRSLYQERRMGSLRQITLQTEKKKELLQQVELLKVKVSARSEDLERETLVLSDYQQELQKAGAALEQQRAIHAEKQKAVAELIQQVKVYEQKVLSLDSEINGYQANIEVLRKDTEGFHATYQLRLQELDQNKLLMDEARVQLEKLQSEWDALNFEEKKRLSDLEDQQKQLQVYQEELAQTLQSLAATTHEYELTKSLIDNLEGYPESIKFLSKQQGWSNQVALFSDLFTCEEGYRVALEHFLEPYLNYFVVSNRKEAVEAISLLSRSQKGKANFFILSGFLKAAGDVSAEALTGLVPAMSKIEADAPYDAILQFLFRDVYFPESDLDDLSLDELPDHVVILHKNGEVAFGKRWMSGGSLGLFEGKKIGRKKNLEKLEKQIQVYQKAKLAATQRVESCKENVLTLQRNTLAGAIEKKNAEIRQVQDKYNKLQVRFEMENTSLEAQKAKHDEKLARLVSMLEAEQLRVAERTKLSLELDAYQGQSAAINDDFRLASEAMSDISARYNEWNVRAIQQKSKTELFARELSYATDEINRTQTLFKENEEGLVLHQNQILTLDSELAEVDRQIQTIIQQRKESEVTLTLAEQEFFEKKNHLTASEAGIRDMNRLLHTMQASINQLKDTHTDIRFKMNSLYERLEIEHQLTREMVDSFIWEEVVQDESQLLKEMETARQKLQAFNDVNPMAVEAFNEIKLRYDMIDTQKADILSARDNLMATISEIDHTARSKFQFTFEKIRENFVSVFRHLFTEDDFCDMVLEDPDNPLDCGIQIIAKPKGKRPQTLQQLSGGEKTLTAIAFLFAIYLIKPAPFCIFDEVDAPLDDANIEKFTKIIRQFSSDSKFIVVTHNKGTMAEVNSIYGVFMEEQGVSNLSRVDFSAFQHNGLFETIAN
jgi:chromosome segregation protein